MKHTKLLFVLTAVLLLLAIPIGGIADFGGFSGSSDYGSSSSSWSSSSGSSWSSSSSSDWGSSSSSWSSGSSWKPSSSYTYGSHYSSSTSSSDGLSFAMLVGIVIIIFVVRSFIKSGKAQSIYNGGTRPQGAQRTPDSKLKAMVTYRDADPKFREAELRDRLSNLYIMMQNGWTKKDISALQPYFTDALFNQYQHQLESFKTSGRTNYVDNIAVLEVRLRGWFTQDEFDHIIVELRTRITDYTVDDVTGKIVSGSKNFEKFMTYEWDLSRKSGVRTGESNEVRSVSCPHCGAPLSINTTAHCPYCDSVVTVDHDDWAITGIKGISQQTVSR